MIAKTMKVIGLLAIAGGAFILAIIIVPVQRTPAQVQTASDEVVVASSGEYASQLGDCVACHTADEGAPFAGGYPIESPFGTIYSSNITPDPDYGIGGWSLDDFRAALYDGIDEEGHHLYPAMPSANYRKLSEADVVSLYDYFMNEVEPVATSAPETDLAFPFNQRWGLRLWQWIAFKDAGFTPRHEDPILDRGAYLVEGPAHCGACHSPRTPFFTQAGYTSDDDAFLTGGVINDWAAPALRGAESVSASWNEAQMKSFLKSGRNAHVGVAGEMADVVENSLQFMTDDDVTAIARYLKEVATEDEGSGLHSAQEAKKATATDNVAESEKQLAPGDDTAAMLLEASPDMELGARLYLDNCNACHFNTGMGADEVFPELVGNSTVLSDELGGLLDVMLNGAVMPSTETRPSRLRMPGFGERLSDEEVATLATFIRQAWGNEAGSVSADAVSEVRESTSH